VAVRTRAGGDQGASPMRDFVARAKDEIERRSL
jgi:hypothetical protein